MSTQQTVLRVKNTKVLNTFTIPDAILSIGSGTTMTITGSGTTTNPYSGNTSTGDFAFFDITDNNGTVYYQFTGMEDGEFYSAASIYLIRDGVQYLLRRSTISLLTITDQVDVIEGDRIWIVNEVSGTGIDYIYIITDNTENTVYENVILDLYKDIPIKINKSYAELQDISKRNSDLSIGLSLPGSKTNNAFFESFFNVDVKTLYFNPTLRVPATVLIDDEVYFDGYLRLNKISVLNSKVEYDVTLYSNIGDLFGKIGNNLLKDLNYGDPIYNFNHNFQSSTIFSTWGDVGFNYDDNPNPYMYPITHNGYEYSGDTVNLSGGTLTEQTRLYTTSSPIDSYINEAAAISAGVKPYRINTTGTGIFTNQLKPALNVWSLIQLMFKTYGYTIKSDFMNTPWMKGLHMYGYFSGDTTKFSYKTGPVQTLPPSGVDVTYTVTNGTEISFYPVKEGTGIPVYCTQDIEIFVTSFHADNPEEPYQTGTVILPANTLSVDLSLLTGVFYSAECDLGIVTTPLAYPPVAPNTYVPIEDYDYVNFSLVIDENIKQIDFLSSIAKKFNLVFIPNPENQNEIIIEPYQFYIGTGNIYDWTDKLSFDKGFTVEPALNFIESELIFTDLEDGDDGNKLFKDKTNRIYGQNNIYNPTNFKSQTKKIETIFSSQVLRNWDDNVVIPLGINYVSSNKSQGEGGTEKVSWEYKGVKTKPKLFYYLGKSNIIFDNLGEVYDTSYGYNTYLFNIRSTDDSSSINFIDAPVISNTMPLGNPDSNKINNDSVCILFNSEEPTDIGVSTYTGVNSYTDKDIYNVFYQNRINNLYNVDTRFLSGYFDLKLNDIKNLKPNDLIKINEQYFTWNKINQFNMVSPELTKVELIQTDNITSTYPTRYFQYYYCEAPETIYKIKTDFTNPQMNLTHFFLSNLYDYNIGLLGGSSTGYTSSFKVDFGEYLPYYIYEVSETEYNSTGTIYTSDPNFLWDTPSNVNYSMTTYWSTTTRTGINLWIDCDGFDTTATTYSITVASPISP